MQVLARKIGIPNPIV